MDEEDQEQEPKNAKAAFPVMRRVRKSLGDSVEMIELDVTPVMNLFMVLIPFLVSMAVFTQIAIIDFSLPPAQTEGTSGGDESKDLDISVVITENGFQIVGTGKKLDMIPRERGQYNFGKLRGYLKAIKFEYPSQKSVVLVIDGNVLYDDIIKFMDACRESQFPDIGLSGGVG